MALPNPKILDLSHWNAPSDLTKPAVQDWEKAKAQGVVGAIIRLGSINDVTGVCYEDYRLREFVAGAKNAGIPIGYYWYMRPKWGGGRQLDYVLKTLSTLALPLDLDMCIDVEEPGADVNGPGSAPYQARDAVLYMATKLVERYPGRVAIYTRQNLWDSYVAPDPYWPKLKLWAARWNESLTSPWSDGYNIFRDWTTWKLWQYSADGNNLAATYGFPSGDVDIDISYYNGTIEQFKSEYDLLDPLESLEKRVLELEQTVAELEQVVEQLVTQNQSLENNINLLNNEIIGLDGQIRLLEENQLSLEYWARNINYKQ